MAGTRSSSRRQTKRRLSRTIDHGWRHGACSPIQRNLSAVPALKKDRILSGARHSISLIDKRRTRKELLRKYLETDSPCNRDGPSMGWDRSASFCCDWTKFLFIIRVWWCGHKVFLGETDHDERVPAVSSGAQLNDLASVRLSFFSLLLGSLWWELRGSAAFRPSELRLYAASFRIKSTRFLYRIALLALPFSYS